MEDINIDYELNFFKLFGYNVKRIDDNYWRVEDEKSYEIGSIVINRSHAFTEDSVPKVVLDVESDDIFYSNFRLANDNSYNMFEPTYNFNLTGGDHVKITLGKEIIVHSSEYGYIYCAFLTSGLLFRIGSKLENLYVHESCFLGCDNRFQADRSYIYEVSFCDKNLKYNNERIRTTYELNIHDKYNGKLLVCEKHRKGIEQTENIECNVEGTLDEAIKMHEMGIKAFNHLHYVLNKLIPFKEDVFKVMLDNNPQCIEALTLFAPDVIEESKHLVIKK